jgi:hypothetical protein
MNKKELAEIMKDFIVVETKNYIGSDKYFITKRSNFGKINACDIYSNSGQLVDCCNAGCYSFSSSDSNFREDCLTEIKKHFKNVIVKDLKYVTSAEDMIKLFENHSEFEKIKKFIIGFEKNNEEHMKVVAWTFWDGSNWKTFILRSNTYCDIVEVDKEIAEKVLSEMPKIPWIDGIIKTIKTKNFSFTFSKYESDPWICSVQK